MPYPDDFCGTPYDAERCIKCGQWEYTNDDGICGECERRECQFEKLDNASHCAYLHMMLDIANVKTAKAMGWI